jgi:hypothetical protein
MRLSVLLTLAGAASALSLPVQAQKREAGAHEHGRGTLNIAVEGNKVTMELEVPGVDIVGFEHVAKTRREKQAVEKAKSQLQAPLALFKLPAAAACRATEAKVEFGAEEDEAKAKDGGKAPGAKGGKAKHDDEHSEFHAQYTLECQSPVSITGIEFPFFRAFAAAERLDVNVITAKGQNKFEVSRKRPSLSLAGMI